jgi:hypothetical protein
MSEYIATFHTHLAAMRSERTLKGGGISARLSPVPRALSASCGTCVRYQAEAPCISSMDRDLERVVKCGADGETYEPVFEND